MGNDADIWVHPLITLEIIIKKSRISTTNHGHVTGLKRDATFENRHHSWDKPIFGISNLGISNSNYLLVPKIGIPQIIQVKDGHGLVLKHSETYADLGCPHDLGNFWMLKMNP